MRLKVLVGALAVSLGAAVAHAQTAPEKPAAQGGVPTVTIINKSAAGPAEPAPPTLTVSPAPQTIPKAPEASVEAAAAQAPSATPASETAAERMSAPQPASGTAPASAMAEEPKTAAVTQEPPPEPTLGINIDLTRQVMTVSENGTPRYTWKISSARYGYRTPTGTFQPTWMSKMWYSRQYDYAPMPHAVFFHKGVAIHATYAINQLGRPASHGCVRLAPKNAAALFKLVNDHGKARTEIVVHGTPDHSYSERVASRERDETSTRRAGYRYLPPSYAQRGNYAYAQPPPGYYAPPSRKRRYYAAPRPYYQPRGLYNSYSYGYGF
ncbi:MAG TPA: L,D-transpeptidase [Hyphomicrobium zavarzinii]|nr:L,D-transpeptidase [Hyphomicrobium zavarzinii]